MSNSQVNKIFIEATDNKTMNSVLSNIASHYGISNTDALDELINDEAEHLLDYMTEPARSATRVIMQRHGLSA